MATMLSCLIATQVERITYNALPAELTGGMLLVASQHAMAAFSDGFSFRHVVTSISPTAESDCCEKHDTVSCLVLYCIAALKTRLGTHSQMMGIYWLFLQHAESLY